MTLQGSFRSNATPESMCGGGATFINDSLGKLVTTVVCAYRRDRIGCPNPEVQQSRSRFRQRCTGRWSHRLLLCRQGRSLHCHRQILQCQPNFCTSVQVTDCMPADCISMVLLTHMQISMGMHAATTAAAIGKEIADKRTQMQFSLEGGHHRCCEDILNS